MPTSRVTIELEMEKPTVFIEVGGLIARVGFSTAAEKSAGATLQNQHESFAVHHGSGPVCYHGTRRP
jgi:hypothetical protein